MAKISRLPILILMTLTLLTSCAVPVGKPIVTYERNSATVPKMSPVGKKGLYVLYPGNGITPLTATYLNPGDKFGFDNSQGKVAGAYIKDGALKTVALDGVLATEYVWKYEGEKQP